MGRRKCRLRGQDEKPGSGEKKMAHSTPSTTLADADAGTIETTNALGEPALRSMNLVFLAAALAGPAAAVVDTGGAADVFREAKTICVRDNGALWGRSLCGPILIVDPTDSAIVANQADAQGVLKPAGTVYTGTLPPSEILANTSVEWSGTMWSELLWPLPEDMNHRHVMLAHEMFHRIQPDLGIVRSDGDNRHLDTLEGRYLLQLEWRALAAALTARGDTARNIAVADALLFRRERERLFPGSAAQEWALESNEGVAEYTGVRLGADDCRRPHGLCGQRPLGLRRRADLRPVLRLCDRTRLWPAPRPGRPRLPRQAEDGPGVRPAARDRAFPSAVARRRRRARRALRGAPSSARAR